MKVKSDHRSKFSNLSNWKEEAWKNQDFNEIRTRDLREYRCDALPTELWSHTLGARSNYWVHIFPCSEMTWSLYEIIHICTAVVDESEEKVRISRFLSTGHGILPSCGCKARETIVAKCELVLWGTSPVKPYLAENISLQIFPSIAIFWDLQPLWPSSLTRPDLLRLRCSSAHVLSKTKSVTLHFFTFLTSLTHQLSMVKFSEKNQC